ncbi:MAG TPA: hypothetical protein VKR61_16595 [Bryobacteraceae bacterium]|nr:hypothetical protein [Bryobacteraceae bacterium]
MPTKQDPELLHAALIGLQHKLGEIDQQIADLRRRLGAQPAHQAPVPAAKAGGRKRTMSPAARRRIALAQKKRWAAYKAEHLKPAAPKPAAKKPAKRVMSAEGRARIIAATKKRWAAFRKAQKAKAAPARQSAKKAAAKKAAPAVSAPAAAAPAAE